MKNAAMFACLSALAFHAPGWADDRLDGMKKMNSEGCVKAIAFDQDAPKDAKQVKPYCTCVYDTYYGGFSKAEQEQLFTAAASDSLKKSLPTRLSDAKAQCRKKLGS